MRLLDLFCGGGGASYGYELAGFEVVGVDLELQPKYKGEFIQGDALDYCRNNFKDFDLIHASPPCQKYSLASMQFRLSGKEYVDLIDDTRVVLQSTKLPYVIENVPGSPLEMPIVLCGTMFGMKTYRHRLFETNWGLIQPEHPKHVFKNTKMGRKPKDNEFIQYVGHFSGVKEVRGMTGLYWLGQKELAQSIPPQYTKYIGEQFLKFMDEL